jgi:geranylgeranylglycerol-phosphate geranylgeranyltransferase
MIGFAVIIGAFVSKPSVIILSNLLLGFVTGFTICAYSMIINDYYDIEVDKINRPSRPLPSGKMSSRSAISLSLILLVIGTFSALLINVMAVAISSLYAILSWIYNFRAKAYGVAGNTIVASSLAIPFIYGSVVVSSEVFSSLLLFMASTSFLAGVGREIVKAMADTVGDSKRRVRSYAILHGMKSAAVVGAIFFLSAVAISLLPILSNQANQLYRVGVIIPDILFIFLAISIVKRPTAENALQVKSIALFGMLIGLVVFIAGAL